MQTQSFNIAHSFAVALIMAASLGLATTSASAQSAAAPTSKVILSSKVKIERISTDAAGKETATLFEPKDVVVVPGDRVVFTLDIQNTASEPATGFRATNPIPAPVNFVTVTEDWAEVSVDGGTSWGKLASMTVTVKATDTTSETTRAAVAEDVTHVRWVFANAIAPSAKTSVSYRGVVK